MNYVRNMIDEMIESLPKTSLRVFNKIVLGATAYGHFNLDKYKGLDVEVDVTMKPNDIIIK